MSPVALMPESSKKSEYCIYTSLKIDVDVLNVVRAAASLDGGKLMQEWASDVLNQAASKAIGRKPLARKPPPPGKKRGPKTGD